MKLRGTLNAIARLNFKTLGEFALWAFQSTGYPTGPHGRRSPGFPAYLWSGLSGFISKIPLSRYSGVLIVASVCLFAADSAPAASDQKPQLWFAPKDPIPRPAIYSGGSTDYLALFNSGPSWEDAAKYVSVFKLYPQFVSRASDEDLGRVVRDLERRGIPLAIEIGILHQRQTCGHIEGHDNNQVDLGKRIQRLGGEVAYFVADEPLYFGHSFAGKQGCRDPLPSLAEEAAGTARAFRAVFPNVKFVETEPISNFQEPDWVELIGRWHAEFARAFGEPFSSFTIDVNWQQPWRERAAAIVARMRADHMPIGLICNGDRDDPTDQAWIDHARQRCEAFERVTGAPPDIVVFQSWVPRPTHVLPEDAPDSFTHLILEYARSHHLPPARPEGR